MTKDALVSFAIDGPDLGWFELIDECHGLCGDDDLRSRRSRVEERRKQSDCCGVKAKLRFVKQNQRWQRRLKEKCG